LAGIGAEEALVDNKITDFLVTRLKETFLGIKDLKVLKTVAGLDCRPCDELPVVGPLFGNSRILLAGGFMGLGISQGLFAGLGLADLVVTGQSVALPRLIYPERLRSL
jgi:glycine/D-amino acid oxidase-like deaminating enzyme